MKFSDCDALCIARAYEPGEACAGRRPAAAAPVSTRSAGLKGSPRADAGLHFVRSSLRKRAAEVRRGQLDVYHTDPDGVEDIIDGYLRPMQARLRLQDFRRSAKSLGR